MDEKENTATSAAAPATDGGNVGRVGVRVPPFYPQKPSLWFAQLESQFALANITTDATKYHYAVGHLDPQFAAEVDDIIAAPPAPDKYAQLKNELIRRLSSSQEKRVKQVLYNEELGDQTPTQFLRRLISLAGAGVPEDFLRTVWSGKLPTHIQTIIASQPSSRPLQELAELADKIHDVVVPTPQVATATSQQQPTVPIPTSDAMSLAELTKHVYALHAKFDRMSREKSRSSRAPSRQRSKSGKRSASNYRKFPTCWYHYKFADKASRCVPPCDFAENEAGNR